MKAKLWIVLIFMLTALYGYSQKGMEFTQSKISGENKTVYFHVKGLGEDQESRTILLDELIKDENVISGRIFTSSTYKTRCQLLLPMNITPEYVREILLTNGYDYEFTAVSIDGQLKDSYKPDTYVSNGYEPNEDFPQMKNSGNKAQDIKDYELAKEKWISENQKKYNKQKAKGTAEYPIVIEKKVFDTYTAEKQQRLLSEPKLYIIK